MPVLLLVACSPAIPCKTAAATGACQAANPARPPPTPAAAVWDDAVCYFKEQQPVRVGRPYGRVCRRRLRQHLLDRCVAAGVRFVEAEVETASSAADAQAAELRLADGRTVRCRLPVLASGVAAGKLLRYEAGVPPVAAQTAYGIEVRGGKGSLRWVALRVLLVLQLLSMELQIM